MMSIYFRTYRENGTPKPVKSWAVLGYPVIPTEKSGQRGRCKVTNNTVTYYVIAKILLTNEKVETNDILSICIFFAELFSKMFRKGLMEDVRNHEVRKGLMARPLNTVNGIKSGL